MNNFYKYFILFVVSSVFGWLVEVIFCLLKNKKFENRSSLIYGPFGFAYGIGAVLLTLALNGIKNESIINIFLVSFLIGTISEYIMSWGMEFVFGYAVWDYSKKKFNINGRVCLLYSIYWGFLGVVWSKYAINIVNNIPNLKSKIFSPEILIIIMILLIIDTVITFYAMSRSTKRMKSLKTNNKIDAFFDKNYNDKFLKRVLPQMFEYRGKWL